MAACLALAVPSIALAAGDVPQQAPSVDGQAGLEPQMEPLDTEYATYILKSLGPFAWVDEGDYVPSPVRTVSASSSGESEFEGVSTPASYDLRSTGKLTPVRNQGSYGTCWAFAANGSLESGLMPTDPQDFSEDHMALASGFFSAGTSAYDLYNHGGNFNMSTAYLARWSGPVYESDEPYGTGHVIPGLVARKHVQDVHSLPARSGPLDNDTIKTAIMTYGAVETSMKWTSSAYKSSTRGYYYSGTCCANHAVDLVGWSDSFSASNFAVSPPGPGAWLVRNSWGTSFGSGGYFYISYYDGVVASRGSIVVDNAEPTSNYGSVLQYDTLGHTISYGYGNPTAWLKNQFPVSQRSTLRAVAFHARTAGSTYEVYTGSGTSEPLTSGTLATAGYHTVTLPSPVLVPAGSTLSVIVKITTPGTNYPIPVEAMFTGYSDQATSSAGECLVSSSGTSWYDMGDIGSVCLKAFVDPIEDDGAAPVTELSATPASDSAGWNNTDVSVTLSASDTGGVRATYYRLNSGSTHTYASPISISAQGTNTLTYWSVDWADHTEPGKTATFRLDTLPPSTTLHRSPAANSYGWTQGSVVVTLTASDSGSGLDGIHYRVGSGSDMDFSAPISFTASGTTTLSYWATDALGNDESVKTESIKIDPSPPSVTLNAVSHYTNIARIRATGSDTVSGIARTEMSIDTTSSWTDCTQISTTEAGTHTVYARVFDMAGNSEKTSAVFSVTVLPIPDFVDCRTGWTHVGWNGAVHVGGTLMLHGTPVSDLESATVELMRMYPGGSIETAPCEIKTDGNGFYYGTPRSVIKTYYILHYRTDDGIQESWGRWCGVMPSAYVQQPYVSKHVRSRRSFPVYGRVSRVPVASRRVILRAYHRESGHWRYRGKKYVYVGSGSSIASFKTRMWLKYRGTWCMTATVWDGYNAHTTSTRRIFYVR